MTSGRAERGRLDHSRGNQHRAGRNGGARRRGALPRQRAGGGDIGFRFALPRHRSGDGGGAISGIGTLFASRCAFSGNATKSGDSGVVWLAGRDGATFGRDRSHPEPGRMGARVNGARFR
ncbi:MAG TPA: hypothetical protein VGQ05_08845 [Streptosporangiaceae bacterium]|nr:hypothetical protein [Streptosporangiaceae bacterium]